jgi:nucleotide-binding universal stress UspA family protein
MNTDGHANESAAVSTLEFRQVIPRLQSLLSSSRPLLRLNNVLVPISFSENSLRPLPYAAFLSRQFGCTITLLHAVYLNIVGEERGIPLTGLLEEMESAAQRVLDKIASSLSPSARSVVRAGEPASVILKEASQADVDLIIIGEQSRRGFSRWLKPSLSKKVIARAPCPTLVI